MHKLAHASTNAAGLPKLNTCPICNKTTLLHGAITVLVFNWLLLYRDKRLFPYRVVPAVIEQVVELSSGQLQVLPVLIFKVRVLQIRLKNSGDFSTRYEACV